MGTHYTTLLQFFMPLTYLFFLDGARDLMVGVEYRARPRHAKEVRHLLASAGCRF